MNKKSIKPITRRKIHTYTRAVIQLLFFIWMPSVFTSAFSGVKYIFTQIGCGERIAMTSFLTILIVLCLYTIVFGRFFCGYACAFGSLGDAVRSLYTFVCKKLKKKPCTLKGTWLKGLSLLKYVVLLAVIGMCFKGIYGQTRGTDPWEVFSMLRIGNLQLESYFIGAVLLLLIIVGMALCERFFCRFLCPMGAIFALLPALPVTGVFREKAKCLQGCSGCNRTCPAKLDIPNGNSKNVNGDCIQCGKCIDVCPKQNIRTGASWWSGNALWYTLFRAALLAAVLWFSGI